MQQVLVHKDNKRLRGLLRKKISSWDLLAGNNLVKEVEDYLLPTIVYNYYLKKTHDSFITYLQDLDFKDESYWGISNVVENHLESCEDIIGEKFLGDLHPAGSTKLLVGDKVMYQKYPDYNNLLSSLASSLFSDYERFFPKIYKKDKTFERDFVIVNKEAKNKKELGDFYLNLGRIIPFLLFIRAIDLNAENGLVDLPYPVFFDMETIFSGDFAEGFDDYGVKNSGLVKVDEKNDSSFLTGGLRERESLLKPLICGTSRKPYIGWRTKSQGRYDNLPKINNRYVNPTEYLNYIKEGYFDTVKVILQKRSDLEKILAENDAYTRVVIRPTRMYRFLILKSCYPQVYLKGERKEFIKNTLNEYSLIYKFKEERLLEKEVDGLLNLKVPVFYSSLKEKEIFCPMDESVGVWYKTPHEVWKSYSMRLGKSFFEKQWAVIKESFI